MKLTEIQAVRKTVEGMMEPSVVDGIVRAKNDAKGEIEVQVGGSTKWVIARVVDQVPMSDLTVGEGCLLVKVGELWYCVASYSITKAKREEIGRNLIPAEHDVYDLGRSGVKWRNVYASTIVGNLAGDTWNNPSDLYIEPEVGEADGCLYVRHPGVGYYADLDVERNIALGGLLTSQGGYDIVDTNTGVAKSGSDIKLKSTAFANVNAASGLKLTGTTRKVQFDTNDYLVYSGDIYQWWIGIANPANLSALVLDLYTDNGLSIAGINRRITFATNDYLTYDVTNDRYLFYIGGTCRFYIDTTGGHNGSP